MVIGRPVVAQMRLHAKVRAKSAARRWKAGGPQGWLAEIRRDGAPAGSPRKRVPAERQHPKRSACRRSVPFGLPGGGDQKTGSPGPPTTGAMTHVLYHPHGEERP